MALLHTSTKNRLPQLPNELVGRADELASLTAILKANALVTLTGPGGIGKTSLAILAARSLEAEYPDGIFYVELAPITKDENVLPAILSTVGIDPKTDEPLRSLEEFFADKRSLLILDNFEQVIDAAGDVALLRQYVPSLPIIVTSREALRIRGEQELPLQTLRFPDTAEQLLLSALQEYPALHLFVSRIKDRDPHFEISESTLELAITICEYLDGLPLALELAAARSKSIGLHELCDQLTQGIGVLSNGPRDLPKRHQTLLGTIKWSYDLLDAHEQSFLRGLAVFPESWTVEMASAVILGKEKTSEALEIVTSLIEKNLVKRHTSYEDRFVLLVTIRQFTLEECERANEWASLSQRFSDYMLEFAIEARSHYLSPKGNEWLERSYIERENYRAALEYFTAADQWNNAAMLAAKLWWFWRAQGMLNEGYKWIMSILKHEAEIEGTHLIRLYFGAASLTLFKGRMDESERLARKSAEWARKLDDPAELAIALNNLGMTLGLYLFKYDEAELLLDECLVICKETNNMNIIGQCMMNLGSVAAGRKDFEKARRIYEEVLEYFKGRNDLSGVALTYGNLGHVFQDIGDTGKAIEYMEHSIAMLQNLKDLSQLFQMQHSLALAYYKHGNIVRSVQTFTDALLRTKEMESHQFEVVTLIDLANLFFGDQRFELARNVIAHARTLIAEYHLPPDFGRGMEHTYQMYTTITNALLTDTEAPVFSDTKSVMRSVLQTVEADSTAVRLPSPAVADSTSEVTASTGNGAITPQPAREPHPLLETLSEREREVLRFVAQGMKDAEIADTLFLSVRTVNAHLRSIYSKLNIKTRSQATRFALEENL